MSEPRYIVSVWDLIEDPEVPSHVVQRALTRRRAAAMGIAPPEIPDEDIPHLARHARPAPSED